MGISNLVNAAQGDAARSHARLARTGRQRTFVLKPENEASSSKVSTKDDELQPSTSKQQDLNEPSDSRNDQYASRHTDSSRQTRAPKLTRSLNSSTRLLDDEENASRLDAPWLPVRESSSESYERNSNQLSANIRSKLKSRFRRVPVDENATKRDEEHKEFNQIKSKVDNRIDKTYSWRNKLISMVTGRDRSDDKLITYQTEYEFFSKPSKTLKQPNKLENLLNNQLRSYLEGNHNLYYPSLKKANMLLAYPNLDEELKNFIKQNDLPLNEKFAQRILIEKNENLAQRHLDLILNSKSSPFELSTNLEDSNEEFLNHQSKETNQLIRRTSADSRPTEPENVECIDPPSAYLSIAEEFALKRISFRFLRHKHSTREMNLTSEIISNLEYIDELNENRCIGKLTSKIEKLREVIELIENCVQEYETRFDDGSNNLNSSGHYETIQKTSIGLIKNYLFFMNFLYIERDRLVNQLRTKLFNLLKHWKELNTLRQNQDSPATGLNLAFEEQLDQNADQQNRDEQLELGSLIEERLEFEKKFAQFKSNGGQLNQRLRSMFSRLVNKSESNENLISEANQEEETIFLNIKNKAILLDGRLPGEPRFYNFRLINRGNQEGDQEGETQTENKIENQTGNQAKQDKQQDKLKQKKYLVQIFNSNKLIYESKDYELDADLQVTFGQIEFKENPFQFNLIVCHLIEIKRNRKKLLCKLELNVQQILIQTQLYSNTSFSIKADFTLKASSGELVVDLSTVDSPISDLLDRNLSRNLNALTSRTEESSPKREIERTADPQTSNLMAIKYDFNDAKSGKFEFKDLKEELKDKDKLHFIMKMKNEIYNQKELSNLLTLIKNNYRRTERGDDGNQERTATSSRELLSLFDQTSQVELNQRLALLKQRNDDEFELGRRRIPLYDSAYLSFLIKDKEQVKSKAPYLPIELSQTSLNVDLLKAYDNKRKSVIEYLIDVRKKFINQSNSWNKNSKNYEDYVYEEIDTSLTTLNFDFLFLRKESNRPLRPNRKERKKYQQSLVQQLGTKVAGQSASQGEKVKIMINVMQGQNIPVRRLPNQVKESTTEATGSQAQLTPNYASFTKRLNELFQDEMHSYNSLDSVISKNIAIDLSLKEQKVYPFLEITFQGQTVQTAPAEGSQPAFNETIRLDLEVPNDDYSPSSLLKIDDFIQLNLYDRVEVVKENELDLERKFDTSPKKYIKNWLGSISIPFITLYLNGKMEGAFALQKPVYLTNYDFESKPTFSLLTTGHNQELDLSYLSNLDSKRNSYLSIYLTIDPQLNLPTRVDFKCSTDEETAMYNYAKDWQTQQTKRYPNRAIRSLVINLVDGKHVLITRYLAPLEPPTEFLNTEQFNETTKDYRNLLMRNLARYVSMVPMLKNELASAGLIEDIWADCGQFLNMGMGCVEEHAVLLSNFFLYLGLNCGLLLGNGVPEGRTCYVIVWLNELDKKDDAYLKVQLWNPTTGQCYFVHTDNFLPLSSADCIVTRDNVYANIQKEDQPNQISFNVMRTNCWRPLFNVARSPGSLKSIQPNKLDYEQANANYVTGLEQQIEVYLKESLMKWRRQRKTFFNRFCTKEIKKELGQMEYKVCFLKEADPNEEINRILSTYRINGVQLNVPFNGIDQLAKLVYSTGIHLSTDEKVDFVIAVHLHPYGQNVFSTWLYCAQILAR